MKQIFILCCLAFLFGCDDCYVETVNSKLVSLGEQNLYGTNEGGYILMPKGLEAGHRVKICRKGQERTFTSVP